MLSSLTGAQAAGDSRYFTGKPCKRGHITERRASDGMCMDCVRLAGAKWRATEAGKDCSYRSAKKFREKFRAENPEAYYARKKFHREAGRERAQVAQKIYREKNRARILAKERAWIAANRDKVRMKNRSRKARRRGGAGAFTLSDISQIRAMQRDKCACCRVALRGRGTVDHIVALVSGGSNYPANLQLLCRPCNGAKGTKHPIEFMQSRGYLI